MTYPSISICDPPAEVESSASSRPAYLLGPARSRLPIVWLPPRRPGQRAASIREMLPPLYEGSKAAMPARIDPARVIPGDRIGAWQIITVSQYSDRYHGFPCHCIWGTHATDPKCSWDEPTCPCTETYTVYWFTVRCDCGTTRTVNTDRLICGASLSCGHCRHRDAASHDADLLCGVAA
jgi:hypothetical protein